MKLCSVSTLKGAKSFDVIITSRWYALTIIFKPAGYSAALETIKPSRLEGEKKLKIINQSYAFTINCNYKQAFMLGIISSIPQHY